MTRKLTKVVLATKNQHKVSELRQMLALYDIEVLAADQVSKEIDWVEDGLTFEENALIKAKAIRKHWDGAILADDSGLSVDALDGAPGIYSSRFAGENASDEDNNKKLLESLNGFDNRKAYFVCCLCFATETETMYFNGKLHGSIAHTHAGHAGFGYDPIFIVENTSKHLAEYSSVEKNKISHRSNALQLFVKYLEENNLV